ncbi:MAG: linear amide C-N hydrolase [Lachnospiraceae bacterium]|nr:linear amide C-N hydrolase [Lachnospiraceae bacterium]
MREVAKIFLIILIMLTVVIVLLLEVRIITSYRLRFHAGKSSKDKDGILSLKAGDGIVYLEKGLFAARFDGDYGLDDFLKRKGAASDQEMLRFLADYYRMDCETLEIRGAGFGCSTISVPSMDGGYLFGRNFDWLPCDAMIVEAHPGNGYSSISTVNMDFIHIGTKFRSLRMSQKALITTALYVPLDGMNEKGLCVSVNMIHDSDTIKQSTGKPNLTTTTAIRLMLDKAANVEEALALLKSYDLHASMNYMIHFAIADANGNSVAVEYVHNKMVVIQTPILTNFYLTKGDKHGIGTEQSKIRYKILGKALDSNTSMTVNQVRDILDSVGKHNFRCRETTEWSIVFDQKALTAYYYHREHYKENYQLILMGSRKKERIKKQIEGMDVRTAIQSKECNEDGEADAIWSKMCDLDFSIPFVCSTGGASLLPADKCFGSGNRASNCRRYHYDYRSYCRKPCPLSMRFRFCNKVCHIWRLVV